MSSGKKIVFDGPGGAVLQIKVVPGASATRVAGVLGDRLKVQVAAAPEKGKANTAVLALLAKTLGVSDRALRVLSGHGSPRKTILIRGMNAAEVIDRLALK